ncbi:MAG: hemin uptake protein HemP [Xanthobacteraceae bacterium]|nr:hemin uptake protein HemP [Xanthobacteraceae bacterium]
MPPNSQFRAQNSEDEPAAGANADVRMISLRGQRFDSRDLFIGTREIIIDHGGDRYRLRLTAQNKLILTK